VLVVEDVVVAHLGVATRCDLEVRVVLLLGRNEARLAAQAAAFVTESNGRESD
jgi:hypothetical protein